MNFKYLIFFLIIILFCGCSYNSEDDLVEEIVIEGFVTYDDNIKTIIDNNCIGCHSSPPVNGAPMALTTYSDVKNAVENRELIERISSTDASFVMPFGGPRLPQNIIDLVIQWEEEGLLEN
jgi:cytochrome c peroxidase